MQNLTPEIAESLGLSADIKGVVVSGVEPGSTADDAGLAARRRHPRGEPRTGEGSGAYRKALKAAGKGKSVLFLVRRGDNTIFLALKPSAD